MVVVPLRSQPRLPDEEGDDEVADDEEALGAEQEGFDHVREGGEEEKAKGRAQPREPGRASEQQAEDKGGSHVD